MLYDTASALRTLAEVRPRNDMVDRRKHPRVADYAWSQESSGAGQVYAWVWREGYLRFGDEMEAALAAQPKKVKKSIDFVAALPDPWMVLGKTESELGENFFEVWRRFRVPERTQLLTLAGDPMPSRSPELLAWLGKRLDSVPRFFMSNSIGDQSYTPTWMSLFAYNAVSGHDDRSRYSVRERDRWSVTEAELCELMDAGLKAPIHLDATYTLQGKLAQLHGTYTPERRALGQVPFRYQPGRRRGQLKDATARFFEHLDGVNAEAPSGSIDLDRFEVALANSDGLSLNAMRERLGYSLPDPHDIHGLPLTEGGRLVWERMLALSERPELFFTGVVFDIRVEDAEAVLGWMPQHVRPSNSARGHWLEWVMLPEHEPEFHEYVQTHEGMVADFLAYIGAGITWQQVYEALVTNKLKAHEAEEVLLHGTPVEYVLAMRDGLTEGRK